MKPKAIKVILRGMGENQYGVQDGIWLTEKQFNELVKKIYDPNACDKPVNYGGRWFTPADFKKAEEPRDFDHELVQYSGSMSTALLEAFAREGYIENVKKACAGTGYSGFAQELVDSGKYKQITSTASSSVNKQGLDRLRELKKQHGLN